MKTLIGIDEVGRGPLAGPICLCAVAIPAKNKMKVRRKLRGIVDSKKTNGHKREDWFRRIDSLRKAGLLDYRVAFVGARIIDRKGIVPATRLGIWRTLYRLGLNPEKCEIKLDGTLYAPAKFENQKTIIKGDEKEWIISTASIIAKVKRDAKMSRLSKTYPKYGFEKHMGYGTKEHRRAIKKYGKSREHRRSFCRNI